LLITDDMDAEPVVVAETFEVSSAKAGLSIIRLSAEKMRIITPTRHTTAK